MNDTATAVARVIFMMKPHPQSREFGDWQRWAHLLGSEVGKAERFTGPDYVEFMKAAGASG